MNSDNINTVDVDRKLHLGALVEVRQKEIGLRGSWHPAKVVRVKHGRRVVEYDDLLTLDQSRKLQESIRLSNDRKMHSPILRTKNEITTEPNKRGFVRPRPPPWSSPPLENWKQGLLVDAFYDGAWWEGILMDDMHSYHSDSKLRVFFPEEGDELAFLVCDLRVSQEWDEVSGEWAIRGYWSLQNEMGIIDISSLKNVCRKGRNFSKSIWRQNKFTGSCIPQVEKQQGLQSSVTFMSQKQVHTFSKDEESQGDRNPNCTSITMQGESTNNSDKHVWRAVGSPPLLKSNEMHASFCLGMKTGFQSRDGAVIESRAIEADPRIMLDSSEVSWEQGSEARCWQKFFGEHEIEQGSLTVHPVSNVKLEKTNPRNNRVPEFSSASTIATRSPIGNLECDKVSLLRSCETASESLKSILTNDLMPQEDKLPPFSCMEKSSFQPLQLNKSMFVNDSSSIMKQVDTKTAGLLPLNKEALCLKGIEYQSKSTDGGLRGDSVVGADYFFPQKARVRQVRLAAKQFLIDAGWTLDIRNRARGQVTKQEVVYISPSGSRFFSLAAACRGWKLRESHDKFLDLGANKKFELLSVYCMAEERRRVQKVTTREGTTEQMTSFCVNNGEGKVPSPLAHCNFSGGVKPASDTADGEKVDCCPTSLHASDCAQVDLRSKKKKIRLNGEFQKKRKIEEIDGGRSPLETRRRKGPLSLKNRGCRMQVLLTCPGKDKTSDLSKAAGDSFQFKKSTVLSWLMDKGILKENEPVSYINRKDGHVMKKGRVTREGVICDCCLEVFTLSNFEAHAGSKLHRPSANTFLDDGRSISDCQLEACAFQDVKEKESLLGISDDTCGVCGDGGELVLCDHCPSTFHAACIALEAIPEGDWYCPRCSCGICGSHQLSAHDIDSVVHRCGQCELQYHLICAQGHTVLTTAESSLWFCDRKCKQIFTALRCLIGISNPLENGFSWTLLRSMKKDRGLSPSSLEEMAEHHSKLSVAHGVMQECFAPMIDPRTNINLLSQAIYNRWSRVSRLNYSGFYTIILERGDEILSVATIRVHGARLAEVPLVGTRYQYRRQGMCRRLMHALEEMLRSMGVEKLLLPAVSELLDTWMGAFNFMKLSPQETRELSKLSLMTFPATTLLQKSLPAGSQANWSICSPYSARLSGLDESPPCKSIEDFLKIARASLDGDFADCINSLSAEANSAQDSVPKVSHIPWLSDRFLSADPQIPVNFESLRGKSRLRTNHLVSSGDGLTNKLHKDDDLYTSVVIATTRSNRLVKSRRWVADGLKELKNAKLSKRSLTIPNALSEPVVDCNELFRTLLHSNIVPERQNIETVYVRTRRKTPLLVEGVKVDKRQTDEGRDWLGTVVVDKHREDPENSSNVEVEARNSMGHLECTSKLANGKDFSCDNDCFGGVHVGRQSFDMQADRQNLDIQGGGELSICAKFYSRRKKRDSVHTDFTNRLTCEAEALPNIEQQTVCVSVDEGEGLKETLTSI